MRANIQKLLRVTASTISNFWLDSNRRAELKAFKINLTLPPLTQGALFENPIDANCIDASGYAA
tara:strand:- start:152 stop:343 length:192 start_codon:yes stop_codon:yes gene_type:complete